MAISITWSTGVINVPKADLTLISGTIYSFNTNQFRLDLKELEASVEGISYLKTHTHNTEVTVAGTTFARTIEILPPYKLQFEDGQYSVILNGSNNNIFDVANGILVQNQVQVIPTNSAGLITITQGSGVTSQDKIDIINGVWSNIIDSGFSADEILKLLISVAIGKTNIQNLGGGNAIVKFRDPADIKDRITASLSGSERINITADVG